MVFTKLVHQLPKSTPSLFTSVPSKTKSTIILDLDETILYRPGGLWDAIKLYAIRGGNGAKVGVPYPSAITAIHQLSTIYHFVAITARYYRAEHNTIGWLTGSGLDGLPVIFAKDMHPADHTRSAYKAAAIRYLRDEGWNPIIGVGDRPSDMVAYTTENLRTFMVIHKEGSQPHIVLRHTEKLIETEKKIRTGSSGKVIPSILYFSDDQTVHHYFHTNIQSKQSLAINNISNNISQIHAIQHESQHTHQHSHAQHNLTDAHPHSKSSNTLPPIWSQIRTLLELENRNKQHK